MSFHTVLEASAILCDPDLTDFLVLSQLPSAYTDDVESEISNKINV